MPTFTTPSANMSLPVPIVGVDPGPDYATNINTCFFFIDSHDHSSGKGIPITQAGINITSAFSFSSNPATGLSYLNFTSQVAVSAQKSLYVLNNDLYFRDGNNGQIPLTAGGSIAGTPGSIGGLSGGASCTYNSANQTFVFAQSPTTAANLDAANVILRNTTSPYNYVTLKAPTALATTYDFVYPSVLPATQKFMTLDGSGNAAAPWAVDGSTIEVASGTTVQVKNLGVTLAKLATEVIQYLVPTGTVMPFGGTSSPSGFLLCDGAPQSRTTYANLFAVVGTKYGAGDGSTTFNMPDLRYGFLRGGGAEITATGSGPISSNNATFTAHGLVTGTQVRLVSGTISGLTVNTDYYVIVVDANTLAFATTYAGSLVPTKITITGTNTGVITKYNLWAVGSGTAASNNATFTAHGVNRTGMRVRLAAGTLSGLAGSTTYFAIYIDANTLAFATSYANAVAATPTKISISGANTAAIIQWEDPDIGSRSIAGSGANQVGLGTRQDDDFRAHAHSIGVYDTGTQNDNGIKSATYSGTARTGGTQGNGGSETRPINMYINYIMKT